VPLRLKPTDWESVFDSRSSNSADPDRCVYFLGAEQKATPDVAPIATHGLQVRCNNRFAYVSVSRAQHDAHIYTNDGNNLSRNLRREVIV
jgi:hypothetical protein